MAMTNVVSLIYQAALGASPWSAALEAARTLVGGSHACFARVGPDLGPGDVHSTEADPDYARLFAQDQRFHSSALAHAFIRSPVGIVSRHEELVGADHHRRSPIYNEWMLPQGIASSMITMVMKTGSSSWLFDVARDRNQPPLDEAERDLLGSLAHHVGRAAEIGRACAADRLVGSHQSARLGRILVDSEMRMVGLNEAADAILNRPGCPLLRRHGRLVPPRHAERRLLELVSSSCSPWRPDAGLGGDMRLLSGSDAERGVDLALSVVPQPVPYGFLLGQTSVILVQELSTALSDTFRYSAAAIFGLTPKEALLATLIGEGSTVKEAAQELEITVRTARSHLESIFRKTETRQQSELVATLRVIDRLSRDAAK